MLKSISAVVVAATIAAAITLLSAPAATRSMPARSPSLPRPAMTAGAERRLSAPSCVGTSVGNPRIRLVTTDRLG